MFPPKPVTFEEKVRIEVINQRNEHESARMEIFRTSATAQQRTQKRIELRNAIEAALKAPSESTKFGKYSTEKRYRRGAFVFQVYDPNSLTLKQRRAVHSMMESLGQDLSPAADFYPFIDLLFGLIRGEINAATFEDLTGIELHLSTWNQHHDHNQ